MPHAAHDVFMPAHACAHSQVLVNNECAIIIEPKNSMCDCNYRTNPSSGRCPGFQDFFRSILGILLGRLKRKVAVLDLKWLLPEKRHGHETAYIAEAEKDVQMLKKWQKQPETKPKIEFNFPATPAEFQVLEKWEVGVVKIARDLMDKKTKSLGGKIRTSIADLFKYIAARPARQTALDKVYINDAAQLADGMRGVTAVDPGTQATKMFGHADTDGDKKIDAKEFGTYFNRTQTDPRKEERFKDHFEKAWKEWKESFSRVGIRACTAVAGIGVDQDAREKTDDDVQKRLEDQIKILVRRSAYEDAIATHFGTKVEDVVVFWKQNFNEDILARMIARKEMDIKEIFFGDPLDRWDQVIAGHPFVEGTAWDEALRWIAKLLTAPTVSFDNDFAANPEEGKNAIDAYFNAMYVVEPNARPRFNRKATHTSLRPGHGHGGAPVQM